MLYLEFAMCIVLIGLLNKSFIFAQTIQQSLPVTFQQNVPFV